MNLWTQTMDEIEKIKRDARDQGEPLTIDQRIQIAHAHALLSVSQELSIIQDQGVSPDWSARSD